MDYRFTAILIIMITLLALFGGPAHSRNEYLNEYGARCGDFETRVEKEDRNNDIDIIVTTIITIVIVKIID